MFKQKSKLLALVTRVSLIAVIVITVAASFAMTFGGNQQVKAATNSTLNFQARLLTASGSLVPDGNYNLEFKIYNAASSTGSSQGSCSGDANCLWTETRITSNKVRVVNGYMTVNLGSVTAFASTINWDQELWLTMNIGGTGGVSWDGEMTPRLRLTAVPYAFRAGQLANMNGANLSTLGWATQTASNSILLPNEGGTLCIQSSSNCGFLTSATGDANYVKLQGSTPGTPQTGNLNISGTGVFGTTLQAPALDRASAGTLTLGGTNATAIALQQNTTLASGKSLTLQGGFAMTPASDTTSVFNVKTSAGNNMFTIDTQNARVGIGLGASNTPTLQNAGLEIKGAIRLSGANGTYSDAYITPKVGGGSVNTLINVVNYDPGAFSQIIALGLPSDANTTSRAISLFDARASAHQPTLGVLSPDQNQIAGFSWDGSDATFLTKTSSNNLALQANGLNIMTLQNVSSVARVGIGNGSPSYPLDVTGDINSSTALRVGGNVVCTSTGCTASSITTTLQDAYGNGNTITTTSARDVAITLADTATDSNFSINMQCTTCSSNGGRFEVQNAGTAAFWLNPGSAAGQRGSAVFRNTTNDVNAFQIQTSGGGSTVFNVDTSNGRAGINNAAPTVALDVGPSTLGASEVVQVRIGDFLLQSQQGAANGLAALTSRGSNGNLTLDGASGAGLYLSPFTTNHNYLAAGGGSVRIGNSTAPSYKLDVAGDVNISTGSAYKINGTNICTASGCTPAAGSANYIQNTTTVQTNANVAIQSAADASVTMLLKERATQSADLFRVVTSDDALLFNIDAFGGVRITQKLQVDVGMAVGTSSDSGVSLLVAPTSDSQVGLLVSALSSGHTGDLLQLNATSGRTMSYAPTGTLTVKGGTTQSADLFSLQNSSSAVLASFTSTGNLTFGNTADKTISIAQASSGNHGNVLTLQGGSGNGTNRNGGNLILQGGNSTGTGTPGSVIVRPQTNTTTAFQVQNAAGTTTVLNADTTNTRIGIGTNAPTSTLHVVSNNATSGQNIGTTLEGAQSVASGVEQFALYSKPTYTAASGTLLALTGGYFNPQNTAGGTVTTMRAGLFKPDNTSTGAVTDMVGVGSYATKSGTGTVTNAYGIVTRIDNTNATGAITNAYGLYIDNSIETGTITNDYGLYQADPGAQNQFFGAVNITNTSSTALRVQNASSSDVFTVNSTTNTVNVGSAAQSVNLSMTGDITWGGVLESPQSFEGVTFVPTSPGTWSTGGNTSWARNTTEFQVGSASAASGTIGDNQTSWLDLNYTFTESGFFSFYWKVSSEDGWDYLSFCVDDDANCDIDTAYTRITGTPGWAKITVPVTAGAHSFRWEYNKDGGVASGSDKGWVDNVQFTGSGGTGIMRGNALTFLAGDTLSFQTSANANALSIDSSGRVGISTAAPTEALTVLGNFNIRDSGLTKQYRFRTSGASLDFEGAAADMYISTWTGAGFTGTQTIHMIFDDASGAINLPSVLTAPATGYTNMCVQNTANREIRRSTSATTCATSSVRYKENVANLPEQMGLDAIMALRPVSYNYKIDPNKKSKVGFIAEEVNGVLPQIVNYNDQGQIDSLDYEYLVANLVKGIQQQQVQINNLRQGVWDGGLVARDSVFNGLVTFNAGVTFKSDATFEGRVNFKNKITYSEDTAGTAVIPKGQTRVEVRFKQPYERAPLVALGASEFASVKVIDKTAEGFTIMIKWAQPKDITVDWVATQIAAPPSP